MHELGRTLIGLGLLIVLVGVAVTLWGRFGLPRLPGDFVVRHGGTTLFLPLATSLVVSIVLTVLVNLLFRRNPR
jgi:multisubunit Na+/H+ antiporter MnhG subunit